MDNLKRMAGEKAAEYVKDGMVLGLGTGSTANFVIKRIGEMVQEGLNVKAVATSKATESLAKEVGITVLSIDEITHVDLGIDGVDEIDGAFNAIKGGGGALFREKIVASLAKEVIWIMDDTKLVESIGAFPLPVEVLQFGYKQLERKFQDKGFNPVLRVRDGKTFVSDNGNYIFDLHIGAPMDIEHVKKELSSIVGVLETGLFLNMCKRIVVGSKDGIKVIENPSK